MAAWIVASLMCGRSASPPAASGRQGDGEWLVTFLARLKGQAILFQSTGYTVASAKGGASGGQGGRLLPPPSESEQEVLLRRWQRAGIEPGGWHAS
ncbi:MAG: hypothetical protein ACK5Q7_00150 [Cyanobacteriota bacterium]